jgi:uncharacterized protein YndB with AHSA1/START domain
MYTIVASADLSYPVESVFAALASIEGTVRWQHGVRAVRRARAGHAAPRDGSDADVPPLVLHYWALGVRHRLRASVTALEPPRRFAYRAEGDGLAWEATYAVVPTAQGCHVTCTLVMRGTPAASGDMAAGQGVDRTTDASVGGAPASPIVRLRRLLGRRLPRDLARLEAWVAVQPGVRPRPAVGASG